jgi:hypothetical protein
MENRAREAYQQMRDQHADPFEMKSCRIFIVDHDDHMEVISVHTDVYEGLDTIGILANDPVMRRMRFLGIDTCGWAAPVAGDDPELEVAPSAHPRRRRVRLVTLVDRNLEAGSALGFKDEPTEIITDPGTAKGSLADSLRDAMACVILEQANAI